MKNLGQARVYTKSLIYNSDGKILLLKRSLDDNTRPGKWDYCGGGLETSDFPISNDLQKLADDSVLIEALKREVREEAGICIQNIEHCHTSIFYDHTKSTLRIYVMYISQIKDENIKLSNEHTEFKRADSDVVLSHDFDVFEPYVQKTLHCFLKRSNYLIEKL